MVIIMANILGFDIFDGYKEEYINALFEKLKQGKRVHILSGNPEVLYNALEKDDIKAFSKECEIIPDGIGVILAGKLTGQKFKEKIAGIEVVEEIFDNSRTHNIGIYLLGAEKWVVEETVKTCKNCHNAIISGYHDGFFDINDCDELIEDINKSGAKVLLVAMGSPRQENFIRKYSDRLTCSLFMGVGGSFDVISGKVKRAPSWMIALGLEWLYRVSKEPARIRRLTAIPRFLLKVLIVQNHSK